MEEAEEKYYCIFCKEETNVWVRDIYTPCDCKEIRTLYIHPDCYNEYIKSNEKCFGCGKNFVLNGNIIFDGKDYNFFIGDFFIERIFKDGKPDGVWKIYHPIRNNCDDEGDLYNRNYLYKTITYKNGIRDGPYIKYFKDGNILVESQYVNNKINGSWKIYNDHKRKAEGLGYEPCPIYLEEEINYLNEEREGPDIHYKYDGTVITRYNYSKDELHGNTTKYYDNGNLKSEENYIDGKLNGIYKTYYDSGEIYEIKNYLDGNIIGESKKFFDNGQVSIIKTFSNEGIANGDYKEYYKNGTLKTTGKFIDGIKKGIWISYYPSGSIKEEGSYFDTSTKQGKWKLYYDGGILKEEGTYENNMKQGIWKIYYPSGVLKAEGPYDEGLYGDLHAWKNYSKSGVLLKMQ